MLIYSNLMHPNLETRIKNHISPDLSLGRFRLSPQRNNSIKLRRNLVVAQNPGEEKSSNSKSMTNTVIICG